MIKSWGLFIGDLRILLFDLIKNQVFDLISGVEKTLKKEVVVVSMKGPERFSVCA